MTQFSTGNDDVVDVGTSGATVPEQSASVWPPADATDDSSGDTKSVAADEVSAVKDSAVDAGRDVAATAKSEAQNVVGEVKTQASGLFDQAKGEANSQAGHQQQRLAGLLGGYSSELQAMTSGQESSGPLTDLARQGADKAGEFSHWLESHEPAELLDEVRSFARRRPVAFLVGAALAGLVVGRATRGFAANAKDDKLQAGHATPALPAGTSDHDSDYGRAASLVEEVPTQAEAYSTDTYGTELPPYGTETSLSTPGYDASRDVTR